MAAAALHVVAPAPLQIAGLVAWFDANRGITLNGSDVSAWASRAGSAGTSLDVSQGTASKQPAYATTGGFNGGACITMTRATADLLQSAAYTLNQPSSYFWRGKFLANGTNHDVLDGRALNQRRLFSSSVSLLFYSGITVTIAPVDTNFHTVSVAYNGASSRARRDDDADDTGNAGTNTGDGLTIGGTGTNTADHVVDQVAVYSVALSSADMARLRSWGKVAK